MAHWHGDETCSVSAKLCTAVIRSLYNKVTPVYTEIIVICVQVTCVSGATCLISSRVTRIDRQVSLYSSVTTLPLIGITTIVSYMGGTRAAS